MIDLSIALAASRLRALSGFAALMSVALLASPALAALSPAELAAVQATPASGAVVPLGLRLRDLDGHDVTLGAALAGRPGLLILSDWRCTQLCGSLLAIATATLPGTGFEVGKDISVAVVGFNPDATAWDGRALASNEIGDPSLRAATAVLAGEPDAVGNLEGALGFHAVRDTEAGRFAHPSDIYVLTTDGRVSSVLNGLSLDRDTLRLALVAAGQGRIGSLVDRLHVLCYGLDPLSGASTGLARFMLRGGATLTLLAGLGGIALLVRRHRTATGAAR